MCLFPFSEKHICCFSPGQVYVQPQPSLKDVSGCAVTQMVKHCNVSVGTLIRGLFYCPSPSCPLKVVVLTVFGLFMCCCGPQDEVRDEFMPQPKRLKRLRLTKIPTKESCAASCRHQIVILFFLHAADVLLTVAF